MRRPALSLIALLFLAITAAPALGQDFNFTAVPRITVGVTNGGYLCSIGTVLFGPTGTVIGGSETSCVEGSSDIFGGGLQILGNRSVTGDIGGDAIFGHLLSAGHGIVGVTTLDSGLFPDGFGLTALVEGNGVAYAQGNLTGTWRIKTQSGTPSTSGLVETALGSITFNAAGGVVGGFLQYSYGSSLTFTSGNVSVSPGGQLTGFVTGDDGEVLETFAIFGMMSPDKNFIVVATIDTAGDSNGTAFLQRDPPPTLVYQPSNQQGTWNVVSLQGVVDNPAAGTWFRGTVEFDASGNIVNSTLRNAAGLLFPPVSEGSFSLDARGFISGGASFVTGAFLDVQATMFQDKKQIIGINRFFPNDGVNPDTRGLFAMFKQGTLGPPPPASQVKFSALNYNATEGVPVMVTVLKSPATTSTVMVDYAVVGLDEEVLDSGTLTFTSGQTSRSFTFTPAQNFEADGPRVLGLRLSNPTNNATLATPFMANLNVSDDESLVEFAVSEYRANEGTKIATIELRRTGGLTTATDVFVAAVPGTALDGPDFTRFINKKVTFPANATKMTFPVVLTDNKSLDGERTVLLSVRRTPTDEMLSAAVAPPPGPGVIGERSTATLVIDDNDRPGLIKLSSNTYTGNEGTVVNIVVQRQMVGGAPLGGNVTVDYVVGGNGSAVAGLDYAVDMGLAGTLTFVGNETTKTVPIRLLQDSLAEGLEFFFFTVSNPGQGAVLGSPSTARINIGDDDRGGIVTLGAASFKVTEGQGNLSVTVKRSGGTASNVSVLFTTGGGSAVPGTDYTSVITTLDFGPNETTKIVIIPILQDPANDGDTTFTITLSNVQGGATLGTPFTATVTILDDESTIQFALGTFTAKEGTTGIIDVVRAGAKATTAAVSVNLSIISAQPGVDFTGPLSRVLTFGPGVSKQSFTISTINNTKLDGNRSVALNLTVLSGGAQLGPQSTALFTIIDDDQPGVFRLSSARYSAREGTSLLVDILRAPAPGNTGPLGGNVSVNYATLMGNASAGASFTPSSGIAALAADFTPTSGVAVFGPNQTMFRVTVPIAQDQQVDPGESFLFSLSAPSSGATLGTPSSAPVTILDDDVGGIVFLSAASYSVREDAAGGNISIVVRRSGGTAGNASIDFSTAAGTAIDDSVDYGGTFATLFFAPGEMSKTIVIPIVDDDLPEGDEVFTVVLSNPQGGIKLGSPSSAPVKIVDDELVVQFSGRFVRNLPEVVRTGSMQGTVSVDYVATSGTAILGEDFVLPPGRLVFPPGVGSLTIPIKGLGDNLVEGTETFTLTLLNPSEPARLGPRFEQIVLLDDSDFGGTVNFTNTSPTGTLGQAVPITLRRTGGLGTIMTVTWQVVGGTADGESEFFPSSGSVEFLADQSTQTFLVNITSNPSAIGKTIVLGFTVPVPNAVVGPASMATITIIAPVGGEPVIRPSRQTSGSRSPDIAGHREVVADAGVPPRHDRARHARRRLTG